MNLRADNSPEAHARRVIGRIGANPVTWLQHQVEQAKDISPTTLAHIRGLFRKLRAKHGRLISLPDDVAEREFIRIAFRMNLLRCQERLMRMKDTDSKQHVVSKTIGIWAAATLKFKPGNGKQQGREVQRRAVPTAALPPRQDSPDADDGSDA